MEHICAVILALYSLFDYTGASVCKEKPNMTTYNGVPYYTGGSPVPDDPNANQGYYTPPAPTGGGAPIVPTAPNAGDVDPATGNRWSPEYGWLPANFFSDLNPPTGFEGQGGYSGGPGVASLPATAAALASPVGTATGGIPVVPTGATGGQFFELPDQYAQYFPQNVLPMLQNYLRQIGFQGTGNVGQYGERTWLNPAGAGQYPFSMDSLLSLISDPQARSMIQWFLGERGMPGFSRIAYPGSR